MLPCHFVTYGLFRNILSDFQMGVFHTSPTSSLLTSAVVRDTVWLAFLTWVRYSLHNSIWSIWWMVCFFDKHVLSCLLQCCVIAISKLIDTVTICCSLLKSLYSYFLDESLLKPESLIFRFICLFSHFCHFFASLLLNRYKHVRMLHLLNKWKLCPMMKHSWVPSMQL